MGHSEVIRGVPKKKEKRKRPQNLDHNQVQFYILRSRVCEAVGLVQTPAPQLMGLGNPSTRFEPVGSGRMSTGKCTHGRYPLSTEGEATRPHENAAIVGLYGVPSKWSQTPALSM